MSAPTMKARLKDHRVLGALTSGPKSTREIADLLRREVWEAWAVKHDFTFEWESEEEPVGARILAMREADELGLPYLMTDDVYARLASLEGRGFVERIQLEGHRPMLWKAT